MHSCSCAQRQFPLLFLLLRPHLPGDSWQGGQRTIQKEAEAPEQNAEPLNSREARCQPVHTKGPSLSVSATLWPQRRLTSSRHPFPAPAASGLSYFFTFGYFISAMAFVASICFSFKCWGHMLSTQSTRSTWKPDPCQHFLASTALELGSHTTSTPHSIPTIPPPPTLQPAAGQAGQGLEWGCQEGARSQGPTTVGRLTKCSSLVWLNSRLITLYSFSR